MGVDSIEGVKYLEFEDRSVALFPMLIAREFAYGYDPKTYVSSRGSFIDCSKIMELIPKNTILTIQDIINLVTEYAGRNSCTNYDVEHILIHLGQMGMHIYQNYLKTEFYITA